jgi:hypothetical protein
VREPEVRPGDYADLDEPEDDLDIVIAPVAPAIVDVEFEPDILPRRRPAGDDTRRRPVEDGREARLPSTEPGDPGGRPQRAERPPRGDRPDSGDAPRGRGRDRGSREVKPPRVGPSVKQLYPPADMEDTPRPPGSEKAPPFDSRRTPRGPMMRKPGEPPPPKGKVRQLYPAPELGDLTVPKLDSAPANGRHEGAEQAVLVPPSMEDRIEESADERVDAAAGSIFISDADELEDRRRRARERAEERRRTEPADELGTDAPKSPPWDFSGDDIF